MSVADTFGTGPFQFAAFNFTADGNNTAVAAVTGKQIRVVGFGLSNATTAGAVTFTDAAGGATIATINFPLAGYVSWSGGPNCPAFQTSAGNALVLSNGVGVDTAGFLVYYTI